MDGWSVVVPVKRLGVAKSRLHPALPGVPREELALALALDTVRAALRCPAVGRVVVVTDDPTAAKALLSLGAIVVPDLPDAGLNPALEHGARVAADASPRSGVAVLSGDLAALRPEELSAALAAARRHVRAFVADAAGSGTTLLAVRPGTPLAAAYGERSRAAHLSGGAVELTGDWPSLRTDIDTAADLERARALGLGPATAALLG